MKKFLFKLLILFLSISVIIIPMHCIFMNNYVDVDNEYKNKFYDVPYSIEVCNFGSSHGQLGFKYDKISSKYICFNFALASQSLSYDYRILKNYKNHIKEGAYVFIPVSDYMLFGEKQDKIYGYINKNQRYYYFLPPNLIENFDIEKYIYVKLPWLNCNLKELIDVLLNRNDKNVSVYTWKNGTTYVDCVLDTKERTGKRVVDENGYYYYKKINDQELNALYDMIDLCKEIKAVPILLTMPMTGAYSETTNKMDTNFFNTYYDLMNKVANEKEVKYIDYRYDKRLSDNYNLYKDSDHLNDFGAIAFVDILVEEVIEK